ncbi:MAG: hypothetical protein E7578_01025 [Ruminococcaceae bacterium]|nr:hypothetical protein [Oscillospiraceae bacterium]
MGIIVYFVTAIITASVCIIVAMAAGLNTMSGAVPVVMFIISIGVATFVHKNFNSMREKAHINHLKKIPKDIKKAADAAGVTPFEYIKPKVNSGILSECEHLRCITNDIEAFLMGCVRNKAIPKSYMPVLYAEYTTPKDLYGTKNAWSKYNEK